MKTNKVLVCLSLLCDCPILSVTLALRLCKHRSLMYSFFKVALMVL